MKNHRSDLHKRNKQLLFQLLKCSQYIERETNYTLRQFGIKQQQFTVLNEIILNGPVSQKELVDNLLYAKSNISRIVRLLSERRFIQVIVSPIDRRLTLLTETTDGREVWDACTKALDEASNEYLSQVSSDEVKMTVEKMRMVIKSLEAHRKT